MMALWVVLLLACICTIEGRSIDQTLAKAYKSARTSEGDVITEYDMVFRRADYERRMSRGNSDPELDTRKATLSPLWTNGVIPYQINARDFTAAEQRIITQAMRDWEAHTCLTFRPKTATDKNYIFIRYTNTGCNSYVGMDGGSQRVSLDTGCRGKDTVIHELGHALGFEHEHQRPDRVGKINVIKDNINETWTWALDQMEWTDVDAHSIPYDYASIMHYGRTAFGKNMADGSVMQTIQTTDPSWQYRIGTGQLPSFYDYKMANLIYKCASRCGAIRCRNDGYLDENCRCQCKGSPVHPCDDGQPDGPGYDSSLACRDVNDSCDYFKDQGYCDGGKFQPFMTGNCRQTCGFC